MEINNNQLAIIIPYYKLTFFKQTLESVAKQTDNRFNVYIGDDCSPNLPNDLLQKYTSKLNIKYERFDENIGGANLVKQWDRCIALSKTENWIMILGDDDTLSENYVQEFYKYVDKVESQNIQVVRIASQLIDENDKITSKKFENPEVETAARSYMRAFKGDGRSTLTEHIFTRKTYLKNRFKEFPVAFGSDNVAWLEFPEMGNIFSINTATAYIRISEEHLSSKKDNILDYKRREGIYLFNRYIITHYKKYFSSEDQILILKKSYQNLRRYSRETSKLFNFILFSTKHFGVFQTMKIIKENRNL